jgi:hypothetical protein
MRNREIKSASPVSDVLKEGFHTVRLISAVDCDSFTDIKTEHIDGRTVLVVAGPKQKQFKWASPTLEIGIHVGNDEGTIVTRLRDVINSSFKKSKDYPDLTSNPEYTDVNGYLCRMINGKLDREVDPKGQAKCVRIMQTFGFAICDGKEGVDLNDAIDLAIANKTEFIIKVVKDPYVNTETGEVSNGYTVDGFYAKSKFVAPKTSASKNDIPAELQA